jgi:hypothetical protein
MVEGENKDAHRRKVHMVRAKVTLKDGTVKIFEKNEGGSYECHLCSFTTKLDTSLRHHVKRCEKKTHAVDRDG